MGLLEKLRPTQERPGAAAAPAAAGNLRVSNALKDFLWLLGDVERGRVLDLGPVWQSTVSFFVERNFKVYTEDLLRSVREHLRREEARLRSAPAGSRMPELDPAAMAEAFLNANLQYPAETFHAVLAWDVFDYVDAELLPRMVSRLYEVMRPNGLILALFHSRAPEGFHRYRIADTQHIELVSAPPMFPALRSLQNREILNLFERFRTSKTFVGRDQLREALITR